jgi:ParB/RepB/Spo0J family partition protein
MAKGLEWIWVDEIAEDQRLGTPRMSLVESVARDGQMLDPKVRRREDGKFEIVTLPLIAAAARLAGLKTLDVVRVDGPDARSIDRQRIAACAQRESANHLYLARCIVTLLKEDGVTQATIARDFDLSRAHISHLLRVVECPDLVAMMEGERLAFGAAKVLAGLTAEEREPLLRRLRLHKGGGDRFLPVAEITRIVAAVREESEPELSLASALVLAGQIAARGRTGAVEIRGRRRKRLQIVVDMEAEDLARMAELVGGKAAA